MNQIYTILIAISLIIGGLFFIPAGSSDTIQTSFGYWKVEAYGEDDEGNQFPLSVVENQGTYLFTFFYEGVSFSKITWQLQAKATGNGYDLCRIFTNQIRSQGYVYSVPSPNHECFFNSQYGSGYVDIPLDNNFHNVLSRTFDFSGTTCTNNLPGGNYKFETTFTGTAEYCGVYSGTEDERKSASFSITGLKSFTISGTPPSASYTPAGGTVEEGDTISLTGSGSCPAGGSIQYRWKRANDAWTSYSTSRYYSTSFDYPATYTISLQTKSTTTNLESAIFSKSWTVTTYVPPPTPTPTTDIEVSGTAWFKNVQNHIKVKASSGSGCQTEINWGDGTAVQTISSSSTSWTTVYHTYGSGAPTGTVYIRARSKASGTDWGSWEYQQIYLWGTAQIYTGQIYYTLSVVKAPIETYQFNGRYLGE